MQHNSASTRNLLESKLREISNPAGWRDSIAVRPSADSADTTQHAIEREMASRGLTHNANLMRELRAAFGRIDDGSYGSCVDCEKPISASRLTALPWAARCLSCQERKESAEGRDVERLAA